MTMALRSFALRDGWAGVSLGCATMSIGDTDPADVLRRADPVRGKPWPEGQGRIARTAQPSYNDVVADTQGDRRRGTPEVTPGERRAAVAHSAQEPIEAT